MDAKKLCSSTSSAPNASTERRLKLSAYTPTIVVGRSTAKIVKTGSRSIGLILVLIGGAKIRAEAARQTRAMTLQ